VVRAAGDGGHPGARLGIEAIGRCVDRRAESGEKVDVGVRVGPSAGGHLAVWLDRFDNVEACGDRYYRGTCAGLRSSGEQ